MHENGQNPFRALQKLFISVNTLFTRGFLAKIPVYEGCAAGAILGDFGQLWATLGFSGLFLHAEYAVYKGFFALKYSFYSDYSCKRVLSRVRYSYLPGYLWVTSTSRILDVLSMRRYSTFYYFLRFPLFPCFQFHVFGLPASRCFLVFAFSPRCSPFKFR